MKRNLILFIKLKMFDMKNLYTRVEKRSTTTYIINGRSLIFILTTCTLALLFANVFYLCTAMFSCMGFIPTISYTGCFMGLDRTFNFATVLYMPVLITTFIGGHMRLRDTTSLTTKFVMMLMAIAICVMFLLISIIDELNGLHFVLLDDVHIFVSLSFFIVSISWVYLLLDEFGKLDLPFNDAAHLVFVGRLFYFIIIWGFITILEWHFAYTTLTNFFVNEVVETLCEWILIIVSAYSPFFMSKLFGNF